MLATPKAWSVATERLRSAKPSSFLTRAAWGAGALVALRLLLGGPLSLLLTGVSIGSLIYVLQKQQPEIKERQQRYRNQIETYRLRYEDTQQQYLSGHIDMDQRTLMMEGLLNRFVEELDNPVTV